MAHHKSAKKRIRQTEARTVINRVRTSRARGSIKLVETAIESGDKTAANEAFRAAQPIIDRAVSKGIFEKKAIDRKKSRLSARIKALETAA